MALTDIPIKCPKKVLVALPPGLLTTVDFVAQAEHRTRSDLIREALRRYISEFRRVEKSEAPRPTGGDDAARA